MQQILNIIGGICFFALGVFMVIVCHNGYMFKKELIREIGKYRYVENAITYSIGVVVFFTMSFVFFFK